MPNKSVGDTFLLWLCDVSVANIEDQYSIEMEKQRFRWKDGDELSGELEKSGTTIDSDGKTAMNYLMNWRKAGRRSIGNTEDQYSIEMEKQRLRWKDADEISGE